MYRQPAREILEYSRKVAQFDTLKNQLEKDFSRAGLSTLAQDFSKYEAKYGLLELLRERLYLLLMEDFDGFMNLMYAADIPERAFKSNQVADTVDAANDAVEILINREWQKICLRAGIPEKIPSNDASS